MQLVADMFDAWNVQENVLCELLQVVCRHTAGERDLSTPAFHLDTTKFPVTSQMQRLLDGGLDLLRIRAYRAWRTESRYLKTARSSLPTSMIVTGVRASTPISSHSHEVCVVISKTG